MSGLSFNITTSKEFLAKLLEDYEEFKKDATSERIAINCAMTAWHLSDWIFYEYGYEKTMKLFNFQESLKAQCPSLQVMQDITHGSKHFKLKTHQPKIEATRLHHGSFDKSFDRSFDISSLDIEMKDGTKRYFEDDLNAVVGFWSKYFVETLKERI
jgi:hypothetical protein